mmetsp:Transcript_18435/g.27512  ORF Transcript_18435/g.27512 Transcript_18435/m.27512 type:complete len:240 (+) Transcript_18435:1-720(+)
MVPSGQKMLKDGAEASACAAEAVEGAAEDGTGLEGSWECLRAAVGDEDHAAVLGELCRGLRLDGPLELLPMLRGALAHAVRLEAEAKGVGEAAYRIEDSRQRWNRKLRGMFDADAAIGLLGEVLELYESQDFADAARELDESWATGETSFADQKRAIDELCLWSGLGFVLLRYGFSANQQGADEIHHLISKLAINSGEVLELQLCVQRQVLGCFSNLGLCDPGPASSRSQGKVGVHSYI